MSTATTKQRIEGFDVARALAILGMVLVHFGLTLSDEGREQSALEWLLDMLDGRAAATFLVLAGVGLSLRAGRAQDDPLARSSVRRSVFRRGLFLLAAGWLLLVVWPGDILRVYGITMLVAAWFLTARSARLWGLIAVAVGGFLLLFALIDYEQNWQWETMIYLNLWTISGQVRNLFYDGFRSVFPWSAFLFFGMWLGRFDWQNPKTAWTCLLGGAGAVLAVELLSWILVELTAPFMGHETAVAVLGTVSMPPLPVFLLAASSTAVAVIGGSVLLASAFGAWLWLRALAATGQLAFTWYIAHLVIGLGTVLVLGLEGTQPLGVALLVGAGFFAGAVILSIAYKRWFTHGPLEWLIRKVAG
jgi:uncharacterized protein